MFEDGHFYEKVHIERWLNQNNTSPLTNEKFEKPFILIPGIAIRNEIRKFVEEVKQLGFNERYDSK